MIGDIVTHLRNAGRDGQENGLSRRREEEGGRRKEKKDFGKERRVESVGLPESYLLPVSAVTDAYYSPRQAHRTEQNRTEQSTEGFLGFLHRETIELTSGTWPGEDACGTAAQSPSSFFRNAATTSIFDSLCDR